MPLPHADAPRTRRVQLALVWACLVAANVVQAQDGPPAPVASATSAPLTRDQVDAAARALRSYPTLAGERSVRRLHLKPSADTEPDPPEAMPSWLLWLGEFASWLNQGARWLVWGLIALALGLLALQLRKWLRPAWGDAGSQTLKLPAQVRGLDIHPESLPADVGAAAWRLWLDGQQLAALSLLYRGALSMLVHRHAVPIRSASTEGDCLGLAQPRLAPGSLAYLQNLVAAWRQAVYAARWPSSETV